MIVGVAPGATSDPAAFDLKGAQDGVAISVENADPRTIAEQRLAFNTEAFAGRHANYERDLKDPRFNLDPVTDDMTIMLHVSPEAGWPVLKQFLADRDSNQLTIGMYHMTAPHVVKAIKAIAQRDGSKIVLTLDRQRGDADTPDDIGGDTKADDIPEQTTLDALTRLAKTRLNGSLPRSAEAVCFRPPITSRSQCGARQPAAASRSTARSGCRVATGNPPTRRRSSRPSPKSAR